MRLELQEIKDAGLQKEITFAAADFPVLVEMENHDGIRFVKPVQFSLRFQKSGQLVEVDGRLETAVALTCGYCLQAYERDLASDFALTFTPYIAEEQQASDDEIEVELDTDELGLVFYKDETIELLQPLQDQLVMALPINTICSADCAGLCSECGCNLNIEKCSCEKRIFNNRFSALTGLKVKSSED